MKLGIIGPGALGTFLAGMIGQYHEVLLLGRKDIPLNRIRIRGNTNVEMEVRYTCDPSELVQCEYVIFCTKSYDTKPAMESISGYISPDSGVVSLQNGLNNERIISELVDPERIIGGVTSHGITYLSPGEVFHAGQGDTYLGLYPSGTNEYVHGFTRILKEAGMEVKVVDNINGHIWQKGIVNACINPLTALTGLTNGALLEHKELHELMKRVCYESRDVAIKQTALPSDDILKEVERVAAMTAENHSSMLQDIQRGRKTEIDCINGAIVDAGNTVGIDTPLNHILHTLVKGREQAGMGSI